MLLKNHNDSTSRVFLSAVPLLYLTAEASVKEAFSTAVNITGLFWLTALFFAGCGSFFPERFRQGAYVIGLGVLAQTCYSFFGLTPLFIVSLALLMPSEIFEIRKDGRVFQRTFLRGLFFIILIVYLAAFQDLLGGRLLVWTFKTPAGALLLLALAAFLWKNQPDGNDGAGSISR